MEPKQMPREAQKMKTRSVVPMKVAKYGYIAIAIIFCLVGIALIAFPAPSARTIAVFFGVAMIGCGWWAISQETCSAWRSSMTCSLVSC